MERASHKKLCGCPIKCFPLLFLWLSLSWTIIQLRSIKFSLLSLTFTFLIPYSLFLPYSLSKFQCGWCNNFDLKLFLWRFPLQRLTKPRKGGWGSWTWLQLLGVYFLLGEKRRIGEGSKILLLSVPLTSSRVYLLKGLTANTHERLQHSSNNTTRTVRECPWWKVRCFQNSQQGPQVNFLPFSESGQCRTRRNICSLGTLPCDVGLPGCHDFAHHQYWEWRGHHLSAFIFLFFLLKWVTRHHFLAPWKELPKEMAISA